MRGSPASCATAVLCRLLSLVSLRVGSPPGALVILLLSYQYQYRWWPPHYRVLEVLFCHLSAPVGSRGGLSPLLVCLHAGLDALGLGCLGVFWGVLVLGRVAILVGWTRAGFAVEAGLSPDCFLAPPSLSHLSVAPGVGLCTFSSHGCGAVVESGSCWCVLCKRPPAVVSLRRQGGAERFRVHGCGCVSWVLCLVFCRFSSREVRFGEGR